MNGTSDNLQTQGKFNRKVKLGDKVWLWLHIEPPRAGVID